MLRYRLLGNNVISVRLNNGYSVIVISIWDKEEKVYRSTFYLNGDGHDTLDLIEAKENIKVKADMKTLKVELAKMITQLLTDGFFKHYIERYEYMMKCFDKGNELFEATGNVNA